LITVYTECRCVQWRVLLNIYGTSAGCQLVIFITFSVSFYSPGARVLPWEFCGESKPLV